MAIEVNDQNFQEQVLQSPIPVVVDFWASWCGPCRAVSPILEEIAKELEGKVKVVKLNVDDNQSTAMKYQIRSLPSFKMFKSGKATAEMIGAYPKSQLKNWIETSI